MWYYLLFSHSINIPYFPPKYWLNFAFVCSTPPPPPLSKTGLSTWMLQLGGIWYILIAEAWMIINVTFYLVKKVSFINTLMRAQYYINPNSITTEQITGQSLHSCDSTLHLHLLYLCHLITPALLYSVWNTPATFIHSKLHWNYSWFYWTKTKILFSRKQSFP